MIRKALKFIFFFVAPVVIVPALLVFFGSVGMYPKPGPLPQDTLIYIENGTPTRGIAAQLQEKGVFTDEGRYIFLAAAKFRKSNLRAGEYEIKAYAAIKDVIELLESGKTYQRKLTVAEGLMAFEIVDLVRKADALDGVIADMPMEGSLLPETYAYSRGETRAQMVARMQKSMRDTIDALWPARDADLPVTTPEEALVLASVVEKETGIAAERARVAGVFVNRMKIGMPLQSDPTVIYAVTEGKFKLDRPLSRKDLSMQSPYNSYLYPGLPPTPIANPGRESMMAVLHPEKHEFLYFVADGTGGHAFAKTHEEHLRNVAQWRQVQRGSP